MAQKKKETERKVALVGLGYVGLPIAVAFGKRGKVIGFDINKEKIAELQKGFDRTGEVLAFKYLNSDGRRRGGKRGQGGGRTLKILPPYPVVT